MMVGPGNLEPTRPEVQAMIAYHRALVRKEPFLCITRYGSTDGHTEVVIAGEATPGATVALQTAEKTLRPRGGEDGAWSMTAPGEPPFVLTASLGEKSQTLAFPARQWTHGRD